MEKDEIMDNAKLFDLQIREAFKKAKNDIKTAQRTAIYGAVLGVVALFVMFFRL